MAIKTLFIIFQKLTNSIQSTAELRQPTNSHDHNSSIEIIKSSSNVSRNPAVSSHQISSKQKVSSETDSRKQSDLNNSFPSEQVVSSQSIVSSFKSIKRRINSATSIQSSAPGQQNVSESSRNELINIKFFVMNCEDLSSISQILDCAKNR